MSENTCCAAHVCSMFYNNKKNEVIIIRININNFSNLIINNLYLFYR